MKKEASLPKLIAVVGPTASGKTDLAVAMARRFGGEIISADSRQFYRGTEIGSDIIPGKWVKKWGRRIYVARGVPHHLVAFLPPSKTFTAAQFRDHVIRIARDISRRGHVPILAGGTGLYIRTVVDNYDIPVAAPDAAFRRRLEKRSAAALYAELKKRDPAYAARIPANNRRYVIRALEVMRATGRTFSEAQGRGEPIFDILQIGLKRRREELYRRIDARVDGMMERGLLKEASRLGKRYGWKLPAMTGLGHRQLSLHLSGEMSLEEAIAMIKRDTRHYAKRQLTWFRRDKRIKWVETKEQAAGLVKKFLKDEKQR